MSMCRILRKEPASLGKRKRFATERTENPEDAKAIPSRDLLNPYENIQSTRFFRCPVFKPSVDSVFSVTKKVRTGLF
jgi:hypothetical protein